MVFHQSDSTGTLVSLDRTQPVLFKQQPSQRDGGEVVLEVSSSSCQQHSHEQQQYVQTSLLLEIDEECDDHVDDEEFEDDGDDDDDDDDDCWMGRSQRQKKYPASAPQRVPLFLPVVASAGEEENKGGEEGSVSSVPPSIKVDEYLNQLPYFQEKCDELLSLEHRQFTNASCGLNHQESERVLYCHQGERASSTSDQNDVIVSDRATTCHILAMRSTTTTASTTSTTTTTTTTQSPMASMAHLDGPQYTDCILSMVREHIMYHNNNSSISQESEEEEKKSDEDDCFFVSTQDSISTSNNKITLEFHIMGGFNDEDGTSSELSEWLIRLLADLAGSEEFSRSNIDIDFVLKTCAITSMNDTGYQCPVGRGLAMDIQTGRVYLAQCDDDAMGPASVLRSVYLWTARKHLRVIHSALNADDDNDNEGTSSRIVIEPFEFRPFQHIPSLLKLNDRTLLKSTSTSPDVEEDGFCDNVRRSLRFLQAVSCEQVFGRRVDQPLIFERRLRCQQTISSSSSSNHDKNQYQWDLVRP
mmetsp:Transcript_12017/g.28921  ORF Transcript_12017/g.28921 Transcript_12017/m.28921 type:complete len:528 (-) Transcript_12017:286-1869(-)|eukprot:CAMPEP_0113452590 /NCGR_PEP_ID=MMETSP0014_2-20120614/6925_1 /TAXON_ID=2857 /ORGANISM="Nitzschia sp." /LENGTH=527 /DNA_ID=CAMNT_0000343967 /DNA_START=90 /DNA_END=1673 /DNA_ORIENTATION=- /assembly_acc=CAM_ASM_000159